MIQELALQKRLLQVEYACEREQFRRQTENTGVARKVRRGLCWFPLRTGRSYRNSQDTLVLEVERTEGQEAEHQFEPGKPVCFFAEDASRMLHYMDFVGQVSYVENDRMVISMPSASAVSQVLGAERVGVQLYLDEYTYRLMFEALDRVANAKSGRLAELRDIIYTQAPLHTRALSPIAMPWLNTTQQDAVNHVLASKDVAILHGPPGTGKTTTMVEAIYETLRRETQVMVCAQSNMAVDWIAQKLSERGVNVLRIGNPMRVTDQMLADTYERRYEAHPLYSQLWAVRRTIRQLYDSAPGNRENRRQKIARLRDRATEMDFQIRDSLLSEARVIACTLTGSASPVLLGRHFSSLFIDEAAQALQAACWIAMQRADRVILAGDHCQLPPTVKSPEALAGGLDRTLMQKVVEAHPEAVSLLGVQYRMTDAIMQFPNREFYGGRLRSDPSVKYRSILDWDTAIEWVDTPAEPEYGEQEAGDGASRQNPAEARLTIATLKAYLERIGTRRILDERLDIGLISPYKGQVRLLRQLVGRDAWWKPLRRLISINTVDGFQGQERDIIMISMVRSNSGGQVGFLRDLRRMNVAITRARMKLILVGHQATLCRHPFYKRLRDYVESLSEG